MEILSQDTHMNICPVQLDMWSRETNLNPDLYAFPHFWGCKESFTGGHSEHCWGIKMFQPSCFSSHPAPVFGFRRGTKPKLTFHVVVHKEVMNEIQHRKRHADESGEYPYGFRAFKNLDDVLLWR